MVRSTRRSAAEAPATPRAREEARRQHHAAIAELEALYGDAAFLDEVRRAVSEAETHGTHDWPTLDDVARTYGLHDEA